MKSLSTLLLGALSVAIFLTECWVFHFPVTTGLDAIALAAFIAVPGVVAMLLLRRFSGLNVNGYEVLSLGIAAGFVLDLLLLDILGVVGLDRGSILVVGVPLVALTLFLLINVRHSLLDGLTLRMELRDGLIFLTLILLFFASYNLQQFHFGSDGAILTRGLFGVDIPFLAGEVHGIQDFGVLRDLHQNATPWHYHDAIYRLLALSSRTRTLEDLTFAVPLVGYLFLAFSVFTLVQRLTGGNRAVAAFSVAAWFLAGSVRLTESSCTALSPSFVFGNVLFLNALIILDARLKLPDRSKGSVLLAAALLFLLGGLSRTKLSTFLTLSLGLMIFAVVLLGIKRTRIGYEILCIVAISFGSVIAQAAGPNPLMPSADFLIGAPLLGYGNHLAALLHVPIHSLNPVSHGFQLRWQSLLLLPYSLFHLLLFSITNPKVLAAVLVGAALAWSSVRGRTWSRISHIRSIRNWKGLNVGHLLLILIPVGALLPIAYSPSWYDLALSFYAPLVGVQAALLWTSAHVQSVFATKSGKGLPLVHWAIILLFLVGVLSSTKSIISENSAQLDSVKPSFISAMTYLMRQEPDSMLVATRQFNMKRSRQEPYYESHYWYGALSGHPVISEGAEYGALLAAVCDTNPEKGLHRIPAAQQLLARNRALLDSIFLSTDTSRVRNALKQGNVAFVLEDRSTGGYLQIPPTAIASKVFSNEACIIWKVR